MSHWFATVIPLMLKRSKIDMPIHQMKLKPIPFAAIESGAKTVEMRLYDEKRQSISVGDRIIFAQTETDETLEVAVVALRRYASFEELYMHEAHSALGYAQGDAALPSDMSQYYDTAEIDRYGVLAIEIRRISQ